MDLSLFQYLYKSKYIYIYLPPLSIYLSIFLSIYLSYLSTYLLISYLLTVSFLWASLATSSYWSSSLRRSASFSANASSTRRTLILRISIESYEKILLDIYTQSMHKNCHYFSDLWDIDLQLRIELVNLDLGLLKAWSLGLQVNFKSLTLLPGLIWIQSSTNMNK